MGGSVHAPPSECALRCGRWGRRRACDGAGSEGVPGPAHDARGAQDLRPPPARRPARSGRCGAGGGGGWDIPHAVPPGRARSGCRRRGDPALGGAGEDGADTTPVAVDHAKALMAAGETTRREQAARKRAEEEDIPSQQSTPQAPKSYQLVPMNKTMAAKQRTYMRRDPDLSAAIVGSVEANHKIDVLARTNGWYQVTGGTEVGYVTRDTLRDLQCRMVKKTRKGDPYARDMFDDRWAAIDGEIYAFADSTHECIRDIIREIDEACSGHFDESSIQFKTEYVGDNYYLDSDYKCEVVSASVDCIITPQIEYEEQVCG